MFHEYIYLENLTPFQKEKVQNFNKDHKIQYEKISNCEICGSEKINILFNNDRYGINQKTCVCDNCGFMFSNPRMTDTSAQYFYNSDLYRSLYDGTGKSFDEETLFKNTLIELRKYKPLTPQKPDFNYYYSNLYFDFINWEIIDFETVLDIGCGKGKKLIDFNFLGKKTYGIEPSKTYHKVHNELGLSAEVGFIKNVKNKYDLVLLTHVLEHLTNLEKIINHLNEITKKYVFIEVPGHVKKLQSIQNAHNYYFSLNTLNHFFLNNNFKLIKINYARDNEFIFALYKKIEKKSNFVFNKTLEKKIIRGISRKYFFKYILIKILKIIRIEEIARNLYNKLKRLA